MKNDNRIYWVARHSTGKAFACFTGRNAKRDATRAGPGKPLRVIGAQLAEIMR